MKKLFFFSWFQILLLIIIINIFLVCYMFFYQNPRNEYYKTKLQEAQKQLLEVEDMQYSVKRYADFLKDKTKNLVKKKN